MCKFQMYLHIIRPSVRLRSRRTINHILPAYYREHNNNNNYTNNNKKKLVINIPGTSASVSFFVLQIAWVC